MLFGLCKHLRIPVMSFYYTSLSNSKGHMWDPELMCVVRNVEWSWFI